MINERLVLSDEARDELINESLHPDYYSSKKLEEYFDSINIIGINYFDSGIEVILNDDTFVNEVENNEYHFNYKLNLDYKEEYLLAA